MDLSVIAGKNGVAGIRSTYVKILTLFKYGRLMNCHRGRAILDVEHYGAFEASIKGVERGRERSKCELWANCECLNTAKCVMSHSASKSTSYKKLGGLSPI